MKTENPIATYHDTYFYFELYEDYLQIHQDNRVVIPYQGVIKNDGEKIYFKNLKGIYFYKELKSFEDVPKQKTKVGWVYECKLKGKHTSFKPIRSVIHGDQGRNQTDKKEEYGQFIRQLIDKALPYQPKIFTNSGLTNRINKAFPFLKLNTLHPFFFVMMLILPVLLIEYYLGDFLALFDIDSWIFYLLGYFGYGVSTTSFLISRFWKKRLIWEEVEQEYLPSKTKKEK